MKKTVIFSLTLGLLALMGCERRAGEATSGEKPKYLWFDAEANFERFATRDSIDWYLDKTVEAGFNRIAVDVRPVLGEVLYNSAIMPPLKSHGGHTVERDWDYLQYFIDGARARNLEVTVSTTMFPLGSPVFMEGPAYTDNSFDDRLCIEYLPGGMVNIKDDRTKVGAFLNPAMPENREFALGIIRELASNYDIDGYALDYCRYPGFESDFSDFSRADFERYIGQTVGNFPGDIFTYDAAGERIPGPLYKKWWEYRSMVIHDFVKAAKEELRAIDPGIELEYRAGSWINAMYPTAQNWASKRYDFAAQPENAEWASEGYKSTGFAEHLDIFLLGTYLENIYGMDDPESIEFGIDRAKRVIDGDCRVYGTIYALNHEHNIEDAVYICLAQSEGLMVFDIIQVIEFDLWDDIRKGIDRAERDLRDAAGK